MPPSGSDMPNAMVTSPRARAGSSASRCSSVPNVSISRAPIDTSTQSTASDAKPRASSSVSTADVRTSAPTPP